MAAERALASSWRTSAFRLALVYCLLFTIGVSMLLGAIFLITTQVLKIDEESVIQVELDALADEYDNNGVKGLIAEIDRLHNVWKRAGSVYLLVDRKFAKRVGNIDNWPFEGVPHETWVEFRIESQRGDQTLHYPARARILTLPDGYLLVGVEVSQRRKFQRTFRIATIAGIGSTALLGTLLGFWLSRRLMARVRAVSRECEKIMAGDLSRRLPVAGAHDEFDALALAVNRVLARLDEQTGVLRATFDSAAHDLRGPLSRLRGRLEDLLRRAALESGASASLERALTDIDTLQRTLGILLQIAQAQSHAPVADGGRIDLGALAQEIAALYEPAARDQGMTLSCRAEPATVNGSRQLLAQLMSNLIENALKHAAAGGEIAISVSTTPQGARLTVADRGPGIPAAERDRVLRPFFRLQTAAGSGSGLGLSLVAAIARLHEARLELSDNEPGLKVSIEFGPGP